MAHFRTTCKGAWFGSKETDMTSIRVASVQFCHRANDKDYNLG
jgi:hypothetical protein